MICAATAAPITKGTLNSRSYRANTRPRKSSPIRCWMIVVEQIATPCATRPSASEMARNGNWAKAGPSTAVVTPPSVSISAIQATLDSRRVTTGVTPAAAA